ncbi:MAG: septum formation family protein [Nocardioidaceae bacterium]|nr:septum formation family protein [Nocardioidaceae bacterium]
MTTTSPAPAPLSRTGQGRPAPPPPRQPKAGACYTLSAKQSKRPANAADPAPCSRRHTARTYRVGALPKRVIGARGDPDTAAIAHFVTPRCDRRFARHVGGTRASRVLSRLQPVWFVPSPSQLARGARWYRCDVVALATADAMARLPRRTAGVLDAGNALDSWGLCSTTAPSRVGHRVICGRPHSWRAFAIIRPGAGSRWPSSAAFAAARQECKARARAQQGYPLRWTYGWQRPSRSQWQDGRRWGYCWAPVK